MPNRVVVDKEREDLFQQENLFVDASRKKTNYGKNIPATANIRKFISRSSCWTSRSGFNHQDIDDSIRIYKED